MPPPPLLAPLIIYRPRGIKVKELNVKYRPLKIFSPTAQDIKEKTKVLFLIFSVVRCAVPELDPVQWVLLEHAADEVPHLQGQPVR